MNHERSFSLHPGASKAPLFAGESGRHDTWIISWTCFFSCRGVNMTQAWRNSFKKNLGDRTPDT